MLVRWPAHGPLDPPDVPELMTSLETWWRFLRNTGRLAGGSADPADLVREAKAAGRKMTAACADQANFGESKQLFAFGREIGITMDDLASTDEANGRIQQIVEAWNALPTGERQRRSPSTGHAGSRMGQALTDAAGHLQQEGELPVGWQLPEPPRLDGTDDTPVFPTDPAVSAPLYRASPYLRQVLALVEWVGEGREVTGTEVLRPSLGKQAYVDLGLWQWERAWLQASGMDLPEEDDRMDSVLSHTGVSVWKTCADCLALDRLWLPALSAGLIEIHGRKATANRTLVPQTEVEWPPLAQMLLLGLASRAQNDFALEPLLGVLFRIAWEGKEPHTEAELADAWWSSPTNSYASNLPNRELARQASDRELRQCLAMFGDTGAWTMRQGKLIGTEIGWDLTLMVIFGLDRGLLGSSV